MDDDILALRDALAAGPDRCAWPDRLECARIFGDDVEGAFVSACSPDRIARLLDRLEAAEWKASHAESYLERAQEYYRRGPTIGAIHARAKDGMLYTLPIIDTHVANGAVMVTVAMKDAP
jgi:hypothetical protein